MLKSTEIQLHPCWPEKKPQQKKLPFPGQYSLTNRTAQTYSSLKMKKSRRLFKRPACSCIWFPETERPYHYRYFHSCSRNRLLCKICYRQKLDRGTCKSRHWLLYRSRNYPYQLFSQKKLRHICIYYYRRRDCCTLLYRYNSFPGIPSFFPEYSLCHNYIHYCYFYCPFLLLQKWSSDHFLINRRLLCALDDQYGTQ